jgi:hypothetical protein
VSAWSLASCGGVQLGFSFGAVKLGTSSQSVQPG